MKIGILSLALIAVVLPPVAATENWPEFRGSNQGHAPESVSVPLTWSASENIEWKIPISGKAWSSPIVVGETVYITTAVETPIERDAPAAGPSQDDGKGKAKGKSKGRQAAAPRAPLSLRALAIGLENGEVIWDTELFNLEAGRIHKKNSHASPTPLYEEGRIYVHFGHNGTACLEAASGEVTWRQNSLPYEPVHGSGSSPIIAGDLLIYSADGREDPQLVALGKKDGRIAWTTPRNVEVSRPFSFATPLLIEVDGKAQVISPCSGALISYEPETGEEIWRCLWGEGYSVTPRPVFAHGLVFASSGFNRAITYAVRPDGQGDVTNTHIAWTYDKTVPKESSFIVVGDEFYMNDDKGILTCMDAKSGEVHYIERLRPEGGYSASPVYASRHLFFTNGEGVTTVIKPGTAFEKVSENELGEYGLSSMAVISDGFLHRTESHLVRIGK